MSEQYSPFDAETHEAPWCDIHGAYHEQYDKTCDRFEQEEQEEDGSST